MEPGAVQVFGLGRIGPPQRPVFVCEPWFWVFGFFGQVGDMAGDNGDYVEEAANGIIFLSLREGTTKQSRSYAYSICIRRDCRAIARNDKSFISNKSIVGCFYI